MFFLSHLKSYLGVVKDLFCMVVIQLKMSSFIKSHLMAEFSLGPSYRYIKLRWTNWPTDYVRHHFNFSTLWCFRPYNHTFSERISILIFLSVSYTSTQIQIPKYPNTQIQQVPEIPNKWHIFEKMIVQGYQKLYSHVSNAQIQDPTCGIFLKRWLFKDIKNDIPMCQKRKYQNKITQIHKHTNTQIQHA